MKKYIIFIFGILTVLYSCRKDCINSTVTNGCPEMYEPKSKSYTNLYTGDIPVGISNYVYPDKYSYYLSSINPSDEYEFCYRRKENGVQNDNDTDLFKYSFCSGKATLIAKHVFYYASWSVKDWVLFTGTDRKLWKIKSNGDSLTQLTFSGSTPSNPTWNTTGSRYIYNNKYFSNEKGELLNTIDVSPFIGWYDSSQVMSSSSIDNAIYLTNTIDRQSYYFSPIFSQGVFYTSYNKKKNEFLGSEYGSVTQNFIRNLDYKSTKFLPIKNNGGIYQQIEYNLTNKLMLSQTLIDTITGNPSILNKRNHIAIMDLDGTNLRQVMIPE
jgi:hypothetical protein